MARIKLQLVLNDFHSSLEEAEQLVVVVSAWNTNATTLAPGIPKFSKSHYEMMVGLAFLRGYLAWEQFVEESFILYLLGKASPRGYSPVCYVHPRNREHAYDFAKGGQRFTDWTTVDTIVERAKRFFQNGDPFAKVLRPLTHSLSEHKIIRNAIAHNSSDSQEKFRSLVRKHLGSAPMGISPGGFLNMTVVGTSPPISYLEQCFYQLRTAASRLIPQ